MTETAFSSVKVITDGQPPGVRCLRGHLLHTVPFLVFFFLFFVVVVDIFSSQLNVPVPTCISAYHRESL